MQRGQEIYFSSPSVSCRLLGFWPAAPLFLPPGGDWQSIRTPLPALLRAPSPLYLAGACLISGTWLRRCSSSGSSSGCWSPPNACQGDRQGAIPPPPPVCCRARCRAVDRRPKPGRPGAGIVSRGRGNGSVVWSLCRTDRGWMWLQERAATALARQCWCPRADAASDGSLHAWPLALWAELNGPPWMFPSVAPLLPPHACPVPRGHAPHPAATGAAPLP